jgi:glycosyltransferase involved in cell wall biosynthesis
MKLLSLCLCLLLAAASADNWAAVGKEKRVLIEGWNAYLHSYSIVNAFHMAHLYPYTLNQSTAQSGAGIKGRASVCDRVPGDGLGDLVETDVKSRPCRLRLHFLELPPYLSRWRPHDRSFMFDNSSHIENVEKIPHLRIPIPQNSLSQHWVPPPEALYDLIKTHVDERGVEHYELHWRFDAVFRIGAPLNIHLPQVPPNTDKKVITTVGSAPRIFNFITSEDRRLYDKDSQGGNLNDWYQRCSRGFMIPLTPSRWSLKAITDLGINNAIVIPHGVDMSVMHPNRRAEAVAYHKKAGLPSAMINDPRSFVFMIAGSMTPNKNAQGLIHAFYMLAKSNPHVYLIMKLQNTLYSAIQNVEKEIVRLEGMGAMDYSRRKDIADRVFYIDQDMSPSQLATLYNLADVYISPFHAEAFNMPVLEAMACGLPIIVPDGGPVIDFWYPPSTIRIKSEMMRLGDYHQAMAMHSGDIAMAMKRAIVHRVQLKRAALRGVRVHVPKFSWASVARRLAFVLSDPKLYPKQPKVASTPECSGDQCPAPKTI